MVEQLILPLEHKWKMVVLPLFSVIYITLQCCNENIEKKLSGFKLEYRSDLIYIYRSDAYFTVTLSVSE